ncbi:MAG: cytosine deaminase [Lactobacillus sp.]|nr:cytosine deaminase [Lactobacillus sp.]
MIIKNVHIENNPKLQDVEIRDGRFYRIADEINGTGQVIDGKGSLLLPPFIDSHVHLDSTLTAGEPEWNETGTLFDGIRIWSERKKSLTKDDVKKRAKKSIELMASNGIQYIRSHVDVTDPKLTALEALLEVREEVKDIADLQLVAFPQEGILSFPHGKDLMTTAVKEGVDAVGGIPHFEFNADYGRRSVAFLMELAEKYDKLVDVHCDEIDDPNTRNLEYLATEAYERGMGARVTASHTTAMAQYNDAYVCKLMRLLKMSGINFVANPLVNMHLGGRFDTYPKGRGITRVKELLANGINVSFGEDDIQDPWNPLGTGNMIDVVKMGVYACHLMGHQQLVDSYKLVTTNASRTLNVKDYGIKEGNEANCVIVGSSDFYGALVGDATVLYSIRHGKVLVKRNAPDVEKNW